MKRLKNAFVLMMLAQLTTAACAKKANDKPSETPVKTTGAVMEKEGVQIKVLKEGDAKGAVATTGQKVKVHYTGWLQNKTATDGHGKKFDSSYDRGEPFTFGLGSGMVIRGWDVGVEGMKVGEKRELTIPADKAYGNRDVGGGLIPPGSTLVFEVELMGVGA